MSRACQLQHCTAISQRPCSTCIIMLVADPLSRADIGIIPHIGAGYCDDDVASCWCPPDTKYGHRPAPPGSPPGTPPISWGRPMNDHCRPGYVRHARLLPAAACWGMHVWHEFVYTCAELSSAWIHQSAWSFVACPAGACQWQNSSCSSTVMH